MCPFLNTAFYFILTFTKDACYDHEGDIEDNLNGVEELEKAIKKFNDDNTGVGSYYPDFNTLVKLF